MRVLKKLLGVALMLAGIYFLGKNIVFTTSFFAGYWLRNTPAIGSVFSLSIGTCLLVFASLERYKTLGWLMIGLGVLLAFLSSRIVLQPTSLWTFAIALFSFVCGYSLVRFGRINI
jgi:hypothetical protein